MTDPFTTLTSQLQTSVSIENEANGPAAAERSILSSRHFDPEAMTPEALMVYVSTRVGALDQQMDDVFERQRLSEKVRSEIRGIQEQLTTLEESSDPARAIALPQACIDDIYAHLDALEDLDERLALDMRAHLEGNGQILTGNTDYLSGELKNTREYLNSKSKDLESSAQMDMIQLQSFMSSRQTAIQLATNLIAALGETQKAVVTNIR